MRGGSKPIYLSLLLWGSREEVTLPKLREALMIIDPSLDKQTLNSYLNQAFQVSVTEVPEESVENEENIVAQLRTILERLQVIDIRRKGAREQEPTVGS